MTPATNAIEHHHKNHRYIIIHERGKLNRASQDRLSPRCEKVLSISELLRNEIRRALREASSIGAEPHFVQQDVRFPEATRNFHLSGAGSARSS